MTQDFGSSALRIPTEDAVVGLLAAAEHAEAWLNRWAVHVGGCNGGGLCECGLTAIRAEVAAATAILRGEA